MVDLCAIASVLVSGWRFDAMEPGQGKGLSRRSQFLLWLLQHQPEVIEVVIEYEADEENGDELLDLSEDVELAEALLKDLLATENDAELEAARDALEAAFNQPPSDHEADGESADGDRAA
jgi:hypothetical protein